MISQKIAFLFLTRGHVPFEQVWKEFFAFRVNSDEYTIYVHPRRGFRFHNSSFFYGREIKNTVQTTYLQASVQMAEKELLKSALEDKDNAYFCLVSESCIPLHPFQAMKHALIASGRSIVNACRQGVHHDGITEVEARWRPELDLVPNLSRRMWRYILKISSLLISIYRLLSPTA